MTTNIIEINGIKFKKGFFQCTYQPKDFSNKEGIVFFYSKNHKDGKGYIVGFYAKAVTIADPGDGFNVQCPINFCVGLENPTILAINKERHLGDKEKIGQIGFNYIEDIYARNILDDLSNVLDKDSSLYKVVANVKDMVSSCTPKYWKIAPGENARLWERCKRDGNIAVGWDNFGDITLINSLEDLKTDYKKLEPKADTRKIGNKAKELWNFKNLKPGDMIVANNGLSKIVGVGKVIETYKFNNHYDEYKHIVPVKWMDTTERSIPEQKDWFSYTVKELSENEYHNLGGLQGGNGASGIFIEQVKSVLAKSSNLILYGPPGTGKTYHAKELLKEFLKEQLGTVETVEEYQFNLIRDYTWYEAIAISMHLNGKDKHYKVSELFELQPLKNYTTSVP